MIDFWYRGNEMEQPRLRRVPLLMIVVMLLGACTDSFPWSVHIPADVRTPSSAGVVEEITSLPDGGRTYRLQSGESVEIPSQKLVLLGGEPLVGELFLAGEDPDGRQWVAGVETGPPGLPAGCFFYRSPGRAVGAWIETASGFRLKKAPDFTDVRNPKSDEYTSDLGGFCLDERGEVTRYEG